MERHAEDAFQPRWFQRIAGDGIGGEAPLFEKPDPVAMLGGEAQVVSDDDDQMAGLLQFAEQLPHGGFVLGVEMGARLIQQNDGGALADGGREQYPLLFSAA